MHAGGMTNDGIERVADPAATDLAHALLDGLRVPLAGAPMAGGPSTPGLAAAVAEAGALGGLAGAYLSPDALREQIRAVRAATEGPFAVNLFVPARANQVDEALDEVAREAAVEAYALELVETEGVAIEELPVPDAGDDDGWDAKLALLLEERVPAVTFTFGLPARRTLESFTAAGVVTGVTVTSPDDAVLAVRGGAGLVIAQGADAGGHRSTFTLGQEPNETPALELARRAVAALADAGLGAPVVASGGVAGPDDVAALLATGAAAVQVGTLLLVAEEAGTSAAHREALTSGSFVETVLTRAFSGRFARGLRNAFMDRHASAPAAFPELNQLTRPVRAAAAARGDAQAMSLWAGTGFASARPGTAAEIVERLAAGAAVRGEPTGADVRHADLAE